MGSTTLQIEVQGQTVFLDSQVGERFAVGSALDCKVSLDLEGILPLHCEVERTGETHFRLRTEHPDAVSAVNGAISRDLEVAAPFELSLAGVSLVFRLATDTAEETPAVRAEEPAPSPQPASFPRDNGERRRRRLRRAAIPALSYAALPSRKSGALPFQAGAPVLRPATGPNQPLPARHQAPLKGLPAKIYLQAAAVYGLLAGSGYAWFGWREATMIWNPPLLERKSQAGDPYATAALGLSLLRGEWGCPVDVERARLLLTSGDVPGHPLLKYGAAHLEWLGLNGPRSSDSVREQCRRALEAGLASAAEATRDPRWWCEAAVAEELVFGDDAPNALRLMRRAADHGYAAAAIKLAEWTEDGRMGLDRDPDPETVAERWASAARLAERQSLDGGAAVSLQLSDLLAARKVPHGGRAAADSHLEEAARTDYPPAQQRWSWRLAERDGRAPANLEAYRWMEAASQAGLLDGRAGLAEYIASGVGCEADPPRALRLAEAAAQDGSGTAAVLLAKLYSGEFPGIPRNLGLAGRWAEKGAGMQSGESALLAGQLARKRGDPESARGWLEEADRLGEARAPLELGRLHLESTRLRDLDRAESWFQKAVAGGFREARLELAMLTDHPDRTTRDPGRAASILSELAGEGDRPAAVALSRYYREGRGVKQDHSRALVLLSQAAEAGEGSAWFPLGELYESGTGNDLGPSPLLAMDAFRKAIRLGDPAALDRFGFVGRAKDAAQAALQSWSLSAGSGATESSIAPDSTLYFHVEGKTSPELRRALDQGFTQLWTTRHLSPSAEPEAELVSMRELVIRQPFTFSLSRDHWKAQGKGTLVLTFAESDGVWRIRSIKDIPEIESLHPGDTHFATGRSLRQLFPVRPGSENATSGFAARLHRANALPTLLLIDLYNRNYHRFPTGFERGVVVLTDFTAKDDWLVPAAFFSPTELDIANRRLVRAATKEVPYQNSLGLEFIPLPGKPGVLMARTETRVRDFRGFARATGHAQQGGAHVARTYGAGPGGATVSWELDPRASWERPGFLQTEDHPVTCVSWEEARAFCQWLSGLAEEQGLTYRLPTDAEWSLAAGSRTKYPWGNQWPPPREAGNFHRTEWSVGQGGSDPDGAQFTAPVGSYAASAAGFFDLGGNVWEWCEDWYTPNMNDSEALGLLRPFGVGPAGPRTARVLRGGAWHVGGELFLRSAFRDAGAPATRKDITGFRIVMEPGRHE